MRHTVVLPDLGEKVEHAQVLKLLVAVGDTIAVGQTILEVETDKAVVEVPATVAGTVTALVAKTGDVLKVGDTLAIVEGEGGAVAATAATATAAAPAATPRVTPPAAPPQPPVPLATAVVAAVAETALAPVPASPTVRKLARELGIDVRRVRGSGPRGRIGVADVKAFVRGRMAHHEVTAVQAPAIDMDFASFGNVRVEPMSNVRRKTAQQMQLAWNTIPHVTHHELADITDLERQRKALAKDIEAAGGKLTMTALLVKVVAAALRRHPKLNASVDVAHRQIIYKEYVHIGIAVDSERGLLVPVLKDADRRSLKEVAVALHSLAARARTGKIDLSDLRGASFTITNLGGIGGTNFTPLINPPEVAVLGVSRAAVTPVWQDGTFAPRLLMPLSLSYDHRLIDGADAARFCRDIAEALATPMRLAIETG